MSQPRQHTLAIDRPHAQQLANFVPGDNVELLALLTQAPTRFQGLWLYGPTGCGRSHLLRGCCLHAQLHGYKASYIGCADYRGNLQALVGAFDYAAQQAQLVAVDDVSVVVGDAELEARLMSVYQALLPNPGRLVIANDQSATHLQFILPDLASRMRSLQHFQIQLLQDEDKRKVLQRRALSLGYQLDQAVLDYWLARGPRALTALLADLHTLDHASLSRKQKVTVPLLKQVLGY